MEGTANASPLFNPTWTRRHIPCRRGRLPIVDSSPTVDRVRRPSVRAGTRLLRGVVTAFTAGLATPVVAIGESSTPLV